MLGSAVLTINPKTCSFSSGKRAGPACPLRSAEGSALHRPALWPLPQTSLAAVTVIHGKGALGSLWPTVKSFTQK